MNNMYWVKYKTGSKYSIDYLCLFACSSVQHILRRVFVLFSFILCTLWVRVITVFTVFRLLTDFVCLYTYEFWLSLWKIVRSSIILLLPLYSTYQVQWGGWNIYLEPSKSTTPSHLKYFNYESKCRKHSYVTHIFDICVDFLIFIHYISQLIRYARASSNYSDFLKRHLYLGNRLLDQGYEQIRLIRSPKKFIFRYQDLVKIYSWPWLGTGISQEMVDWIRF
jgi:hypothetical protein